ncbi:hypothetical protein CSA37_04015 [Candidatus Fermentibacteria bacterium]|nr:MAG: hypothetical protein CSA37_10700 [Candidatus Fermentibacteria bacterium]PIE52818.1 MAG: hypothetical protein CSA37_04015 [Candidatus Fermentibacteria bacterium]
MKINSAVLTVTDEEINSLLEKLELPVNSIKVKSDNGRMEVKVKKLISFTFYVTFTTDGQHLAATVDAGMISSPFVGNLLDMATRKGAEWGLTRVDRTIVLDLAEAVSNTEYQGEAEITGIAAGAGALVIAFDGTLPLNQFMATG